MLFMRADRDWLITCENIALLDGRISRETEKRIPLFRELAHAFLHPFPDPENLSVRDLFLRAGQAFPASTVHDDALPETRSLLARCLTQLTAQDRLCFLDGLLHALGAVGISLTAASFFPVCGIDLPLRCRVAYVHNPYADEAFESFSALLPTPSFLYADGFREACEAVAAHEADFCILPFENSAGPLLPFAELAERFSLCINAICRVFHADGTDATRFALYAPNIASVLAGDFPCLRAAFTIPGTDALPLHLTAFASADGRILRLSCAPDDSAPHALRCTVTLRIPAERLLPVLSYLLAFTGNPRLLGLYKETENE